MGPEGDKTQKVRDADGERMSIRDDIEAWVIAIHRRNGGGLGRLKFSQRFLDPVLALDSIDLAEVMVQVERRWGRSPFDDPRPPRTWDELVCWLESGALRNPTDEGPVSPSGTSR